ncbi:hypothetical protein LOZ61_000629 [Ophidiomyces ophidiicola]|nr:hypothetical protein LOZ61_000629 [Ophidiomyces ophidiicola]KAI1927701.1 hypothetical protein LOZ60_002960 [Ophidiomyces ophidiicola]KAI1965608.1 hypothetical protein LOZ59_001166 [Ophidiomyces ophidiicola]KAI1972771.1 hypothetical protein LOZ56_002290 [Ophidiomyces ophidiicola]KAI2013535.1 hypothetical protein LOZ49_001970 [Ophidiomyces ophidiicola]
MEGLHDQIGRRRKRVSRACDRCRSKKDRCDGTRPSCLACQAAGSVCSYDPSAKKRGLPEGYVRGLEKLWALSLSNLDGLEERVLELLAASDDPGSAKRRKLIPLWLNESVSEKLHDSWKTCELYRELEKLLAAGDMESVFSRDDNENQARSNGPTESFSVSHDPFEYRITRGCSRQSEAGLSASTRSKKIKLTPPPGPPRSSGHLQLPVQTPPLLDLYFSHTHSWFPIIAKHTVLRTSCLYSTDPPALTRKSPGSGDHAALWAILSYTTAQLKPLPNAPPLGFTDPLSSSKKYYAIARSLIPNEKEGFETGHIQALLLLTLVNIGLGDWAAAWLLSSQATTLVLHLGIGIQDSNRQTCQDGKQGNAVFLGCFLVDTMLAARLGRCPQMRPEDLTPVGLLEEDGLEEWNPWMELLPTTGAVHGQHLPGRGPLLTRSCFNRLIELATFLNRAVRHESAYVDAQWIHRTLLKDIQAWEHKLPVSCHLTTLCNNASSEGVLALLPHQIYLSLTHIAALSFFTTRFSTQGQGPLLPTTRLLQLTPSLLAAHGATFSQFTFPPLFECSLHIIADRIRHGGAAGELNASQILSWSDSTAHEILNVRGIWPVTAALAQEIGSKGSSSQAPPSLHGDYSQKALSTRMDDGGPPENYQRAVDNNMERIPRIVLSPQYCAPRHACRVGLPVFTLGPEMERSSDIGTNATDPTPLPRQIGMHRAHAHSVNVLSPYTSQLPTADNADPPTVSDQFSSHLQPATPASTPPSTAPKPSRTHAAVAGAASAVAAKQHCPGNDLDSIFDNFAHLDTNEWATSREQSLKDFGFADELAFQAFCRDPDRVAGTQNNNNNAVFRPSGTADVWPPPGFYPDTTREDGRDWQTRSSRT